MNLFRQLKRPLVFFDLETTGVDPQSDRIVEFAAVKLQVGGGDEELTMLVNPGRPIPPVATEIHGIKDEDVADLPKFAHFAPEIYKFIDGCDLAGFNVRRFDVPLLQEELMRCGLSLDFKSLHIVDACDIFHKREPRTLEGAVKFYCGREHEKAHQALADVNATMTVLAAQLKMYADLPGTVEELHAVFHDKDAVDLGGKLRWLNEKVCINFGKYKGAPLQSVPPSYLKWMQTAGVIGADASVIIDRALQRQFPVRAAAEEAK